MAKAVMKVKKSQEARLNMALWATIKTYFKAGMTSSEIY